MKHFEPYRNIRKQAMVLGLPLSYFALLMVSVIASLLVVIFSFGLGVIVFVIFWNCAVFIALSRLSGHTGLFDRGGVLPSSISNKRQSRMGYEED